MRKSNKSADMDSMQWGDQNPAQLARRRRVNLLLAVALAVVAVAFFFSALLIDFESMK